MVCFGTKHFNWWCMDGKRLQHLAAFLQSWQTLIWGDIPAG